jgi:hypothetical protein
MTYQWLSRTAALEQERAKLFKSTFLYYADTHVGCQPLGDYSKGWRWSIIHSEIAGGDLICDLALLGSYSDLSNMGQKGIQLHLDHRIAHLLADRYGSVSIMGVFLMNKIQVDYLMIVDKRIYAARFWAPVA